jgi:RNA polymerase sigma-70 factor (ECF subfamily)
MTRGECLTPTDAIATAAATAREEGWALARRAAAGDAVATRSLLESVAPRVVRTARTVMGAAHPDIDDAVQLALIGFIQSLPNFRGECSPALFASRIAVRTAGAVHRKARARRGRYDDAVEIDTLAGVPNDPHASRRREVVRSMLDDLPEEQADALAMRFMLGWSLQEIADASHAPLNTVRSRLRLAKQALRRRVEADPELVDDFGLGEDDS